MLFFSSMWQQKILYQGKASGLFEHEHFLAYMAGKGHHIPQENTPLRKMEMYVLEANSRLIYESWKRVVPRGLGLTEARITLMGYDLEKAEEKLGSLFTVECFE